MSKTKVILFLIAVLVIALLSHMLISCRQNYIEGFDVSSLTGGSTPPPTANASTTPTTAATTASTTATTAATPTQSSLGTSPTTSPPSLLANQATGGGTTTETNGLTASPSSVTAPTTTGATGAAAATAAATKAATASTTPTEGFGNLFGASYSSPYWNNNANMDFFANTKFKPECCKNSEYSNSSGCACMPNSQQGYLQKRGNNNNSNKPFYFF